MTEAAKNGPTRQYAHDEVSQADREACTERMTDDRQRHRELVPGSAGDEHRDDGNGWKRERHNQIDEHSQRPGSLQANRLLILTRYRLEEAPPQ